MPGHDDEDDAGWDPALDDDDEELEEEGDSVTERERAAGEDEDEDDGKPLGYLTDEDYEAYVVTDLLDGQPTGSPAREDRGGPPVTGILLLVILAVLLVVVALLS